MQKENSALTKDWDRNFRLKRGVRMSISDSALSESFSELSAIRVLLVESRISERELIKGLLEERGATILTAASGSEAIAELYDSIGNHTQPDIFICNLELSDRDGFEVMRIIRLMETERQIEPKNRLLTIAMLDSSSTADRVGALAAGYDIHIHNPLIPNELIVVVRSLLARRFFSL